MDKIILEGGVALRGEVQVSGAKNAALPILAATLLAEGEHAVSNLPDLADVRTMGRLLASMGCEVSRSPSPSQGEGGARVGNPSTVLLRVPARVRPEAAYELVKTMRASVVVLGPLLARFGEARVSLPGGCAIGARPIDQHLKALTALGGEIAIEHGYVVARVPRGRLRGAEFGFDVQTVTGTENAIMAAALAEGTTVLRNCAREPEVADLAAALNAMGARVEGAGRTEIRVQGVERLRPLRHSVIADRIEAGTLLVAAALTGGDVRVKGFDPAHLAALVEKLREAGAHDAQAVRDGLDVGARLAQLLDQRRQVGRVEALHPHVAAGERAGDEERARLDAIGDDGVPERSQPLDALHPDLGAGGPLDARANRVERRRPVGHLRLAGAVAEHRRPLRQHRRHDGVLGPGDGLDVEAELGAPQAPARHARHHVAVLDGDLRPERREDLEVLVDGAVADRAAAGERHPRLAEAGEERPQHHHARAHRLHELVGRLGTDARGDADEERR